MSQTLRKRAGKPDPEIVLKMFKEGKQPMEVAAEFRGQGYKYSHQAASNRRTDFEERGLLDPKLRKKAKRGKSQKIANREPDNGDLTLENLGDIMIEALEARKKLPVVEAELVKTQKGLHNALRMLEVEQKENKKRAEQERRFKLAKQQGEVGNLTEGLVLRLLFLVSQPNINSLLNIFTLNVIAPVHAGAFMLYKGRTGVYTS